MTTSEIVTTVAVLLSPLIAVQVSQFLADVGVCVNFCSFA